MIFNLNKLKNFSSMFFEGSEKKLEVVVSRKAGDLREKSDIFWHQVVEKANAKIISKIETKECKAYLLSESSLFVWDNRMTLITCGRTTLVEVAKYFIFEFGHEAIDSLIYERKNEYFPQWQPTDFYDDTKKLNQLTDGKAFRFGKVDEHHLHLYYMNKNYIPEDSDKTLEILMYDLDQDVIKLFQESSQDSESLRKKSGIDKIFSDFSFDDHVFTPFGYSLNALKGEEYFTIHVTPQELGCYVSFETNAGMENQYIELLDRVLTVFKPSSFDTIYFHPENGIAIDVPGFSQRSFVQDKLDCGYHITYAHYFQNYIISTKPFELKEF